MKFAAALLFATATASYYAPKQTSYTKAYTSDYRKLDIDAIVTELNRRNEAAVRAIRDVEFPTIDRITKEQRDAVDAVVDQFEADILALREAVQASRDGKRAEIAAANEAIRHTQAAMIAENAATIAALNEAQETLLAEILLADMYYDHTRIAKLLDDDGKEAALTWEGEPLAPVEEIYQGYLSWNQREPAERDYKESWVAKSKYGYGWGQ